MKTPNTMTNEQLAKWAAKTATSIGNQADRGTMNNPQMWALLDRYAELMTEMKARDVWADYCAAQGCDINHDGYDCAA